MKKAKDYWKDWCTGIIEFKEPGIEELIKQAQKDAIEHTLKVAAEKADIGEIVYGLDSYKDQILSLKNQLFKEIEDDKS